MKIYYSICTSVSFVRWYRSTASGKYEASNPFRRINAEGSARARPRAEECRWKIHLTLVYGKTSRKRWKRAGTSFLFSSLVLMNASRRRYTNADDNGEAQNKMRSHYVHSWKGPRRGWGRSRMDHIAADAHPPPCESVLYHGYTRSRTPIHLCICRFLFPFFSPSKCIQAALQVVVSQTKGRDLRTKRLQDDIFPRSWKNACLLTNGGAVFLYARPSVCFPFHLVSFSFFDGTFPCWRFVRTIARFPKPSLPSPSSFHPLNLYVSTRSYRGSGNFWVTSGVGKTRRDENLAR